MKTQTLYFVLIIFLINFYTCNPTEEHIRTQIRGIVTDYNSGNSIPYCDIYLLQDSRGGTTHAEEFDQILKELKTNEFGEFELEFDWEIGLTYGIIAKHECYFDFNHVHLLNFVDNEFINISILPKCWLAFHLKNVNPYNEYDTIRFNTFHNFYVGAYVDTLLYYEHRYDVLYPYRWWVIKNQNKSEHHIVPFCSPLDTCFFEINY